MGKIPVGQTIGQVFRFAFRRYFSVLSIMWLPLALVGALFVYLLSPAFWSLNDWMNDAQHHVGAPPPAHFFDTFRWIGLLNLLMILIFVMIIVGITKEALGVRKGPRFLYLSFGATDLRVIGGFLIVLAVMYASIIAIVLLGAAAGGTVAFVGASSENANHIAPTNWLLWAFVAIGIALYVAWFYFYIRLTYFLVPVTVAEHRFGILRSWELTKGNVWRIVAISLAILIPALVIELAMVAFSLGPVFIASAMHANSTTPTALKTALAAGITPAYMPYVGAIWLIFTPFLYGLLVSPPAFAYRALMPAAAEGETAPVMKEGAHP
jgi:hypothetical protein